MLVLCCLRPALVFSATFAALLRGTAADGPTKALSNAHHCVKSLRALSAMTNGAMPQHHATGHVVRMTPYYWHSPNVDHHH